VLYRQGTFLITRAADVHYRRCRIRSGHVVVGHQSSSLERLVLIARRSCFLLRLFAGLPDELTQIP
jgi:hypothetical protein